jgi:hypothetical protein
MKKLFFLSALFLLFSSAMFAQVGINTDNSVPDNSAMLDVKSTSKGMLVPRMTASQRDAISNPATGLLIFCTDNNQYYSNRGTPTSTNWVMLSSQWITNGSSIFYSGGNVGIGTASPSTLFEVAGQTTIHALSGPSVLKLQNRTNQDYSQVVFLDDWAEYMGYMGYIGEAAPYNQRDHTVELGSSSADITIRPGEIEAMRLTNEGKVGIGISDPLAKLHVAATGNLPAGSFSGQGTGLLNAAISASNSNGISGLFQSNGEDAAIVIQQSNWSGSFLKAFGPNGGDKEMIFYNDGTMELFNSGQVRTVSLIPDHDLSGDGSILDLYNGAGTRTIELEASTGWGIHTGGGSLSLFNNAGHQTLSCGSKYASYGGYIKMTNAAGASGLELYGDAGSGSSIVLKNNAGTATIQLNGDVTGDGRVITQELEITGGSDLTENFRVEDSRDLTAVPGMLVSIDAGDKGRLCITGTPYDKRVAGVISGAGGIETGFVMSQKGSIADGSTPVAIAGRVYCFADASYGAIKPGDLLTSSPVPGHAMKVGNYRKAQGAIVGKALTGLDRGRGQVLILVTLQ